MGNVLTRVYQLMVLSLQYAFAFVVGFVYSMNSKMTITYMYMYISHRFVSINRSVPEIERTALILIIKSQTSYLT
jgi:hypothetical protein